MQKLFVQDATMNEILGIAGLSDVEKVKRILKRSQWDNLVSNERRLCLYFRPSRTARLSIVTNEVLQIDCHVPATQDYMAYRAIARAQELLYNKEINHRIYEFEGQLGELTTLSGFVCVGARFTFYALK